MTLARPASAAQSAAPWSRVKWAEAGQIVALLEDVPHDAEHAALSPQKWCEACQDPLLAIRFVAMALPRLEAIGWAAETIARCDVTSDDERALLTAVARWMQGPDDTLRRAVWTAAEPLEGPARFLGVAVFFSGGSIAPPDCDTVSPPATVCGTAVAGAIIGATLCAPDSAAATAQALDAGRAIAAGEES